MINTRQLVDSILSNLEHSDNKSVLSPLNYILGYRTIRLGLPRQSGKTTTLLEIHSEESSLLFVKDYAMSATFNERLKMQGNNKSIVSFSNIRNLPHQLPEGFGLRYKCFLVDESTFMTDTQESDLYNLICDLDRRKMLHKDFYILMLTT